jgi:hypothetical protein
MLYWIAELIRRARHRHATCDCTVRDMTAVERTKLEQARELARQRTQERKAKKGFSRKEAVP